MKMNLMQKIVQDDRLGCSEDAFVGIDKPSLSIVNNDNDDEDDNDIGTSKNLSPMYTSI